MFLFSFTKKFHCAICQCPWDMRHRCLGSPNYFLIFFRWWWWTKEKWSNIFALSLDMSPCVCALFNGKMWLAKFKNAKKKHINWSRFSTRWKYDFSVWQTTTATNIYESHAKCFHKIYKFIFQFLVAKDL